MTDAQKYMTGGAVGFLVGGLLVLGISLYVNSGDDKPPKTADDKDPDKASGKDKKEDKPTKQKAGATDNGASGTDSYVPQKPATNAQSSKPRKEGDQFPLELGSKGPRVERVQVWLLRNFGLGGQVTGVYDEKTRDRVAKALSTDSVDRDTFHKLGMNKPVHEQPTHR